MIPSWRYWKSSFTPNCGCAPAVQQNYTLAESASTEDIRRERGGDPCFAEFDEDLAEWLGLPGIGFMLALPPLRSDVRAHPAIHQQRRRADPDRAFSTRAGVAITFAQGYRGRRFAVGCAYFRSVRQAEDQITSLSPNGRIYTAANRAAIAFTMPLPGPSSRRAAGTGS